MVVKTIEDNFAPYASASTVRSIIQRFRARGLPDPLSATALESVSVPSSMTAFTLRALVFLGFIDESGNHTQVFTRLRQTSADEYPGTLAEVIRKAYVKVFTVADPAADDDIKVSDAFRVYEPATQRQKMIRLFMGLCEEAEIVPQGSVRKQAKRSPKAVIRTAKLPSSPNPPPLARPAEAEGYTETVTLLHNIGTVTLSVSINPIQLIGNDRTWFYAIVDKLHEYTSPPKT